MADLLCLAQIDKGTFNKNIEKFDIQKAVTDIIKIQNEKIEAKELIIASEFHGFVEEDLAISTDMMRFQQVLLNYQSNAIKFTPDGGIITIKCERTKENEDDPGIIRVEVIDTGIGISEEGQTKLFKMFGFIQEVRQEMNT